MYNEYSRYLKEKYGQKVYKLPVHLPACCPGREKGQACIFCGEKAAGFESLPVHMEVAEQLQHNMAYIGQKYNAQLFIAYFQNYSNTYMQPELFSHYVRQARMEKIVGIDVSTRPDCIAPPYLEVLSEIGAKGIDIGIELGLQSANHKTLAILNRGHSLAEFIDSAMMIGRYNFNLCVHVIIDLPWDTDEDVVETAKIISALGAHSVKLHSLYIVKETPLEKGYNAGSVQLLSVEDYVRRTVLFLEYLNPEIKIQRLIGRVPEKDSVRANFGMSWWKVKDMIVGELASRNTEQGKRFDYCGGREVKKFL